MTIIILLAKYEQIKKKFSIFSITYLQFANK